MTTDNILRTDSERTSFRALRTTALALGDAVLARMCDLAIETSLNRAMGLRAPNGGPAAFQRCKSLTERAF